MTTIEGRVPPHDLDAEAAVLSAVMLDPDAIDTVGSFLKPEHFYSEAHRRIFEACVDLRAVGQPVDVVQVGTWLKNRDRIAQIGGMPYLSTILNAAPAVANVAAYGRTILGHARAREMIAACQRAVAEGYLERGEDYLERTEASISAIARADVSERDRLVHVRDPLKSVITDLAKPAPADGVTGLATGLRAMDQLMTGLHGGDVTIGAARPGQGKTALAGTIAKNLGMRGEPVVFFSLEMPREQIALRLACAEAGVSMAKVRARQLNASEWSRFTQAAKSIAGAPIVIDDTASANPAHMRAVIRRARKMLGRVALVVVDYLQLARPTPSRERSYANREQEIAEVSREMKSIAKEFEVPVLALSQLNRAVEARSTKRPTMADMRESGSLEQDADNVILIHRPAAYDPDADAGLAHLIVDKQRNGPAATVDVHFSGGPMTFTDRGGEFLSPVDWRDER